MRVFEPREAWPSLASMTDHDRQPLFRDESSTIPYSPGLRVGDTIYVSGTIGRPRGGDLPADIAE